MRSIYLQRNACGIYNTKDSSIANKFIYYSLNNLNIKIIKAKELLRSLKMFWINYIRLTIFKVKGESLFMLFTSKKLGTINRKKSIKQFDPFEIEEEMRKY